VLQVARATGRAIMKVNVAATESMWVGEAEKHVQQIFDTYRTAVKGSKVAPILLFNEADAVFCRRVQIGSNPGVERSINRVQNIILEEMEKLEGILIATTNLTENMDKAFQRRFLYRVEFKKPELEPRKKIWRSQLKSTPKELCDTLAEEFDLTGGQIENIDRKVEVDYIVEGKEPGLKELEKYCRDEQRSMTGEMAKIGF
jgi:SpoVK/Ycf46/Vps4 family AAA+-type ATPase